MDFFTDFPFAELSAQRSFLKEAESRGYDGVFGTENRHSPILPIAASVSREQNIIVGTGVLAILGHNPFNIAQIAWDLHYNSGEKFVLGLCTHQDVHLDHRLGVGSSRKHQRIIEYVAAIREIWTSWIEEREPNFESPDFSIRVCPPGFRPLNKLSSPPPIYLLCAELADMEIAPAVADGLFLHPMWNAPYFQNWILPKLSKRFEEFGRKLDIPMISGQIIATGPTPKERNTSRYHARQRVAGYWSQEKYDALFSEAGCLSAVKKFRALDASSDAAWQAEESIELYSNFVCDASYDSLPAQLRNKMPTQVTGVFPNVMSAIPRLLPGEVVQAIKQSNLCIEGEHSGESDAG